jgi:exodeoxyribonuclease III
LGATQIIATGVAEKPVLPAKRRSGAVDFKISTWNINSVRLRLPLVLKFLDENAPDVLCLQETKCPDAHFPQAELAAAGYPHMLISGEKGYNGVAILSKLPLLPHDDLALCGFGHKRHISAVLGAGAGIAAGITIHNLYIPAGGDIADPVANPKFAHKLQFLDALGAWGLRDRPTDRPSILVGDLNIAPLEHDVWSHKKLLDVVSHTPIETRTLERFRTEAGWIDALRQLTPEPQKIYTWWSYRAADWDAADKGRRLDHVWLSPGLAATLAGSSVLRAARGWEKPSDHAPVTVKLRL